MWAEPKTDWQPGDSFLLEPDYRRIRENLDFLAAQAAAIRERPGFAPPLAVGIGDIPTPEFFNRVENAAAELARLLPGEYRPHPPFREGDRVWDWQDLNRLEEVCRNTELYLRTVKNGQPVLAFTLGGNCFEP